ncbi:MAG: GlsB/YeaQ/YmgE family stress response membrane protein [Candidatus Geothermincolia bacterium]
MGIIGWIIIGGLAGWLASIVTGTDHRFGALMNIVIGIVGGLIGGFIFNAAGERGILDFSGWSFLVALIGSVILLLGVRLFSGSHNRPAIKH